MIVFKKLRWRNFLSYGNTFTELDLASHSTTLMIGKNGAGKSTFMDALCFVLYKKPFRHDVTLPRLVNTIVQKNLLVEVEFEIGSKAFLVRRGLKPNVFEIMRDGELLNRGTNTEEYQEVLEKQILKMNYKSFTQIVILGAASYTPFMRLSAADRRKVIEDLLDIEVFSTMNTLLKERITSNKNDLSRLAYEADLCQNKLAMHRKHLEVLRETHADLVAEKNARIEDILGEIDSLRAQRLKQVDLEASIESAIRTLEEKDALLSKAESKLHKQKDRRAKFETQRTFYTSNEVCPTCAQAIDSNFREGKIAAAEGAIHTCDKTIDTLTDALRKMEEVRADLKALRTKHGKTRAAIISLDASINSKSDHIKALQSELASIQVRADENETAQSMLKELEDELAQTQASLEDATKKRDLLQMASVLLKDGGIKTKIVRQYVPIMNQYINKYLGALDSFFGFELDENFNETIKSRFRDNFVYGSFSEGEKARINLAILFSWMQIAQLRNSAACSLLILDEVLDGSLDVDGKELLAADLRKIVEGKNLFVISHGTAFLDKFDRTIEFSKTKNFSRMEV